MTRTGCLEFMDCEIIQNIFNPGKPEGDGCYKSFVVMYEPVMQKMFYNSLTNAKGSRRKLVFR